MIGVKLLENHVFPAMAYWLIAVESIFLASVIAFLCSQWFREKFILIMVVWAVLFFPIYLFTCGAMSRFYVYVFQNMSHPLQAPPYWH